MLAAGSEGYGSFRYTISQNESDYEPVSTSSFVRAFSNLKQSRKPFLRLTQTLVASLSIGQWKDPNGQLKRFRSQRTVTEEFLTCGNLAVRIDCTLISSAFSASREA
jgi:hypothetical protein